MGTVIEAQELVREMFNDTFVDAMDVGRWPVYYFKIHGSPNSIRTTVSQAGLDALRALHFTYAACSLVAKIKKRIEMLPPKASFVLPPPTEPILYANLGH